MNAIRIGLGGVILGLIALPYALLLAIPCSLRWLLLPFAKAAGIDAVPNSTGSARDEVSLPTAVRPHGSMIHRQQLAPARMARNSASLTAVVRRANQAHRTSPIAHHAHSRRLPKSLRPQSA